METINHECYVSLEVAKLLKEAGFDWEIQSYYSKLSRKQGRLLWLECGCLYKENININQNRYSAPTLDVAQRWLREVKGVDVLVEKRFCAYVFSLGNLDDSSEKVIPQMAVGHDTYEQALEAGIKKCLTLILEKDGK